MNARKYFLEVPECIKEKIINCINKDNCIELSEREYNKLIDALSNMCHYKIIEHGEEYIYS